MSPPIASAPPSISLSHERLLALTPRSHSRPVSGETEPPREADRERNVNETYRYGLHRPLVAPGGADDHPSQWTVGVAAPMLPHRSRWSPNGARAMRTRDEGAPPACDTSPS